MGMSYLRFGFESVTVLFNLDISSRSSRTLDRIVFMRCFASSFWMTPFLAACRYD
jgi:hypothetical protein